jgi:hypothetical protein
MQHGYSRRPRRMMSPEIADRLLESLRPTRHLLTRTSAHIPIGCAEYRLWRGVNRRWSWFREALREIAELPH